jgi:hypothetical protein
MRVLKATKEQYEEINGVSNNFAYVEFIKDINDIWVTSINCKKDNTYSFEVRDVLIQLEEIEYEPAPVII